MTCTADAVGVAAAVAVWKIARPGHATEDHSSWALELAVSI